MAQFVLFVLNSQSLMQIRSPDAARMAAHRYHWRKTLPRQKVAAPAGQQDGNGDQPSKCRSGFLHHLFLRMKRLQNDQDVGLPFGREMLRESPEAGLGNGDLAEESVSAQRCVEEALKGSRRKNLSRGLRGRIGRRSIQRSEEHFPCRVSNRV